MTVGTFFWHVVLPAERTNLVTNPSFELGTTGWYGTAAGTIRTSAMRQVFGAYAGLVGEATGVDADYFGLYTPVSLAAGTAYTASAYVRLGPDAFSGGSVLAQLGAATANFPVGTDWTKVQVGTTTGAAGVGTFWLLANWQTNGTIWADGVVVEAGSATTYIDGDQDGCQWLGAPHLSQSYRSGQSRAGGSVVPLAALGMRVETHSGVGMPPVVNVAQDRALRDGAEFQRQRATAREFALTATITGTTTADLHTTRRRIIDAIKIDRTSPQEPTRFLYVGAGGTVAIDAVYNGGLEIEEMGVIDDRVAATFVAHDPMWYGMTDKSGTFEPNRNFVGRPYFNHIAYRDQNGVWGSFAGTVRAAGVGEGTVYDINTAKPGTIIVSGVFVAAAGIPACRYVAAYYPVNQAWGSLDGGTVDGPAYQSMWSADLGTLFVAGEFTSIAGTAGHRGIARWGAAGWGTLAGGSINATAPAMVRDKAGRIVVAGMTLANGTTTPGIARWDGTWGTYGGGLPAGVTAENLVVYPNNDIVLAGGSSIRRYYARAGTWGSFGGDPFPSQSFHSMALTEAFDLLTIGSVGSFWQVRPGGGALIGAGFRPKPNAALLTARLVPLGGRSVLSTGVGSITPSYPLPANAATWNGYSWLPTVDLKGGPGETFGTQIYTATVDASGTLYLGGAFYEVQYYAHPRQIINAGMRAVAPIVRVQQPGVGTARLYQLVNWTTKEALYFDCVLQPGEYITIDLRPSPAAITSSVRGDASDIVMPGCNPSTWRLAPGTNLVSVFALDGESASVTTSMWWREEHWSADGGAGATL
jgi:hypothetical protein